MANEFDFLTEAELEQIENFDDTPLEDLREPIPDWQKDVERITELLN